MPTQKHADTDTREQTIIEAVEHFADLGRVDDAEGGVHPDTIAEYEGITLAPSTLQKHASSLADDGQLVRAIGFSPDGNLRQSFLPVEGDQ